MTVERDSLPDQGVRVRGTDVVEVITPRGERYSIRDIGIGHPIHAVGPKGGRCATDAECALFEALLAERGHDPASQLRGAVVLSDEEADALHRLLDAYTVSETADPGMPHLETAMAKIAARIVGGR